MSATRVLFIDDLEKESTQCRESNGHDEEKPYKGISIYAITKENTLSEKYHNEIDDDECDKSGMFFDPRKFPACCVYSSLVCFFESEIIPKHSEKDSLENRDSE